MSYSKEERWKLSTFHESAQTKAGTRMTVTLKSGDAEVDAETEETINSAYKTLWSWTAELAHKTGTASGTCSDRVKARTAAERAALLLEETS